MPDDLDAARNARKPQLAYSEIQAEMSNEESRRRKAGKIIKVLTHFIGRLDLTGLAALDIGCSVGLIADELDRAGANVTGIDIDEPGIATARSRFGDRVDFVVAPGDDMPFPDDSFDIIVLNHIYEHVVDADAVMSEIRRVLKGDGAVYLGIGNKLGVVEPHYRLPFLSWLPKPLAHRYVRATHKADTYYETYRTRAGLARMCAGLTIWDYTFTVIGDPVTFWADDMVPERLQGLPALAWKALAPLLPTYIWVGTPGSRRPAGALTAVEPTRVVASSSPA